VAGVGTHPTPLHSSEHQYGRLRQIHLNINAFYALAACVGFVMGGIQSLSRSTYAKLMPETKDTTSFFSFFDVTEKVAIVIGMLGFGYITELAGGSQRNSVLSLTVLFIIGLFLLMYTIQAQKKKNHATV
jgi:UMF1 family MFS transporter